MSAKIHVDKHRCKGCGYCVELCPLKTLSMSSEIGPKGYHLAKADESNECLDCGLCESICPDFAIKVAASSNDSTVDVKTSIETKKN
jgi:2-oxoglutarate ferredoxin oxidoreductase subunit delta